MKYAVFGYSTPNLGDDVQALAAAALLPHVDSYVNRDQLDRVKLQDPHTLIMNSWFAVKNFRAVPSQDLLPIYFGFCIGKPELINSDWLAEWRRHQPIGCRDRHTVDLLRSNQISAKYTGCLTAFMGRFFAQPAKRSGIIFLDVPPSIEHLIPEPIRAQAERITNDIPAGKHNQTARYKMAAKVLDRLRCAEMVVTRRLHGALPCIGFKTPVTVYLSNENKNRQRFSGPDEYLPMVFHNNLAAIGSTTWRDPVVAQLPEEIEREFSALLETLNVSVRERFPSVSDLAERMPNVPLQPVSMLRSVFG